MLGPREKGFIRKFDRPLRGSPKESVVVSPSTKVTGLWSVFKSAWPTTDRGGCRAWTVGKFNFIIFVGPWPGVQEFSRPGRRAIFLDLACMGFRYMAVDNLNNHQEVSWQQRQNDTALSPNNGTAGNYAESDILYLQDTVDSEDFASCHAQPEISEIWLLLFGLWDYHRLMT